MCFYLWQEAHHRAELNRILKEAKLLGKEYVSDADMYLDSLAEMNFVSDACQKMAMKKIANDSDANDVCIADATKNHPTDATAGSEAIRHCSFKMWFGSLFKAYVGAGDCMYIETLSSLFRTVYLRWLWK